MRTIVIALVVLSSAQLAFAQGNVGAPVLQRRFEKAYVDTLDARNVTALRRFGKAYLDSLNARNGTVAETLASYRSTGKAGKEGEQFDEAALLGEANLAALGSSAVKPAAMVQGLFRKRDYLALMAQLLFGDPSADLTQDEVSNNLFVPEASQYALNILGTWRPRSQNRTAKEFAVNFGFYYAHKQLPPDSTQADGELRDTGVIHGHVGVEYMVFPRAFSIYLNAHVLSDQSGVDNYTGYFGTDVEQTFTYVAPGLRIKFSDDLFLDWELIVMSDDMKRLNGNDDGVLPILRFGFSQSVAGFD